MEEVSEQKTKGIFLKFADGKISEFYLEEGLYGGIYLKELSKESNSLGQEQDVWFVLKIKKDGVIEAISNVGPSSGLLLDCNGVAVIDRQSDDEDDDDECVEYGEDEDR